jgi:hypothetical protein
LSFRTLSEVEGEESPHFPLLVILAKPESLSLPFLFVIPQPNA